MKRSIGLKWNSTVAFAAFTAFLAAAANACAEGTQDSSNAKTLIELCNKTNKFSQESCACMEQVSETLEENDEVFKLFIDIAGKNYDQIAVIYKELVDRPAYDEHNFTRKGKREFITAKVYLFTARMKKRCNE